MIGNYRIERQLGSGGMGAVFEAIHVEIGHRAAIKVLHRELSHNPTLAARFLNEARAVNLINHPGLVQIFEFGRLPDGAPYIVMDFLDGELLSKRIAREAFSVPQALFVAQKLAAALAAVHERGIIHRDLKPDNVMLVRELDSPGRPARDAVRLLDFGIAKFSPTAELNATAAGTRTGVVMGTPEYMAPEQCMGAAFIDGKVDVYALGVMFYEMLSNHRPFEGESTLELLNQHVYEMPPPLLVHLRKHGREYEVDFKIVEFVERMLAKNPDERPTMQAVALEIERLLAPEDPRRPSVDSGPVDSIADKGHSSSDMVATAAGERDPFPFIAGPPIGDPRLFFGRERELRRLGSLWRQPPLQNAAIIGPRRSGKTSLLLFLRSLGKRGLELRPGQRADYLPAGRPLSFLFIDFQDPRVGTREGLLKTLLRGLRLPVPERCDLDTFMNSVSGALRTPTVVLFDEIGVALKRYSELDNEFWEGMRALATNQVEGNLGFVLSTHQPPHELAQRHNSGSPFFNIFGYTTTLGPLTEAEAAALLASSPLPFASADAAWILTQSKRWPLLLQILCRERLLALQEGDASNAWQAEGLRQIAPFTTDLK